VNTTVFDVYVWNKLAGTYQTLNKAKAALYRKTPNPNSLSFVRDRTPKPGHRAPLELRRRGAACGQLATASPLAFFHLMRKLVAAICFVGIGGATHAQIAVDSVTADLNAVRAFAQDLKNFALQGQQYVTEAQQLAQLVQQYNAFVQNPSLGAAMGLMGQTGLGNDLPINPASLQGLTSGYSMSLSNLAGKLATLSSLSTSSYNQNHVYDCTNQSWSCQQQQQRGFGLAGASGIAQSAYQDLRNHMPIVQALRDQAATATTPAQRENLALALQSETAWNNNLAAQITAAEMQAKADEGSLSQKDNEKLSQSLEATLNQIP
jgi:hypothetical protein